MVSSKLKKSRPPRKRERKASASAALTVTSAGSSGYYLLRLHTPQADVLFFPIDACQVMPVDAEDQRHPGRIFGAGDHTARRRVPKYDLLVAERGHHFAIRAEGDLFVTRAAPAAVIQGRQLARNGIPQVNTVG